MKRKDKTKEHKDGYEQDKDITTSRQSTSLMLDISREEYANERARSNSLDSKANVFISAIIAIFTLFLPIIPFSELVEAYRTESRITLVFVTVMLCIMVTAIVFLILAFFNLYKAFMRVNFDNLNDENLLAKPVTAVEKGFISHYNTILKNNAEINNKKADKVTLGLKYSIISFVLLSFSAVSLIIIIGGEKVV